MQLRGGTSSVSLSAAPKAGLEVSVFSSVPFFGKFQYGFCNEATSMIRELGRHYTDYTAFRLKLCLWQHHNRCFLAFKGLNRHAREILD